LLFYLLLAVCHVLSFSALLSSITNHEVVGQIYRKTTADPISKAPKL
jgi:hypothetical protein